MLPTIGGRAVRGCIVIHRGDQAAAAAARLVRPYVPPPAEEPGEADETGFLRRVLADLRELPDE